MGSRKRLPKYYGALAQLGARLTGSQEVTSSSLVRSTIEKPEDFNVFGLFLVSSDPSYYPKKEHIRSTNSKKFCFYCRLTVESVSLIESILNHPESSIVYSENSCPRIVDPFTDLLPVLSMHIATSQDFSLESRDLCDQVEDLLPCV